MIRIRFPKDLAASMRGADRLCVIAAVEAFGEGAWRDRLPEPTREHLLALGSARKPGGRGRVERSRREEKPRQLVAGILPERVSRYNSPARAEALGHVARAALDDGARTVAVLLVLDEAGHLLAALNALGRGAPSFSRKTGKDDDRPAEIRVLALARDGSPLPVPRTARETVEAARHAASLVDTPPTDLHPRAFAKEARARLRGLQGVSVREITGQRLRAAGLGGIWAVGRCAVEPPRLLVASCGPARAKLHVALVGKGITYDTGGLHLKARGSMEGMKSDMGGAAAVLGAFRVLCQEKPEARISLLLCLAENAVGPQAYKPDDILTMHSGLTVEINNTDAEGRLLLADGASWAARELGADVILDAATLTGAQMVATGLVHAALVSNDAELEDLLLAAGRDSGDLVHPLPFAPELYRHEFRSPIADMRNSVKNRSNAQSSCAAEFVHWHIADTGVRWAHVDMAGPSWRDDRGTGFGVALLSEAVRRLAASGTKGRR